jgi:hypothetical protein
VGVGGGGGSLRLLRPPVRGFDRGDGTMNLRNDACDRIALFAREGRLIQHGWHRTADDGRELACLLGAVGSGVTSPEACPADVMPVWLAHLLPTLFDGLPAERTADLGLRFAAALRSGRADDDVRSRWRARAEADARASACAAAPASAAWASASATWAAWAAEAAETAAWVAAAEAAADARAAARAARDAAAAARSACYARLFEALIEEMER